MCAYLRMPYPLNNPQPYEEEQSSGVHRDHPANAALEQEWARWREREHGTAEERQVRLTAQRIIAKHLLPNRESETRPETSTFWGLTDVDLTGAMLIDFDVQGCQFVHATFADARFEGVAWFSDAQFNGLVVFDTATFTSDAWFSRTQFNQKKSGGTQFNATKFEGGAWFIGTVFKDAAVFHESRFTGAADFMGAQVAGRAMFMRAYFGGQVMLSGASLADRADFKDAEVDLDCDDDQVRRTWPAGWELKLPAEDGDFGRLVRKAQVLAEDVS
jgi:uncharacterized protein YjbI with pentapeptide repeats